jgi:hypothetical protein
MKKNSLCNYIKIEMICSLNTTYDIFNRLKSLKMTSKYFHLIVIEKKNNK